MKSLFIFDEYNKSDKSVVLENFVSTEYNFDLYKKKVLVNYLSYIQTSNVKLEKLLTQKITWIRAPFYMHPTKKLKSKRSFTAEKICSDFKYVFFFNP